MLQQNQCRLTVVDVFERQSGPVARQYNHPVSSVRVIVEYVFHVYVIIVVIFVVEEHAWDAARGGCGAVAVSWRRPPPISSSSPSPPSSLSAPFASSSTSFWYQFFHFLFTYSFTHHFFLFWFITLYIYNSVSISFPA